jgi:hypothetical protein
MRVWNAKHMTIDDKKIDQLIKHLKQLNQMQDPEFEEGVATLELLKNKIDTDYKVGEAFLHFFAKHPEIKDPSLGKFLKSLKPQLGDEFTPGMNKSSRG